MKAIRWHGRRDLRLENVPDAPEPRPGEVRISVEWCGICGTDVEEYRDGPVVIAVNPHPLTGLCVPIIVGHEVSGRVADVGEGVDLQPGQLVALDGMISCGGCFACLRHEVNLCRNWAHIGMSYPGGLAERLTVPAAMAIPASADIASDLLALSEPFAVAVRAIRRSRLTLGETVTVVGGGTIGLAVLQVARAAGSGDLFVVEPRPTRRTKALHVGASRAAEAAGELGLRSDVVIDCTGSPAGPAVALSLVRSGGRIVVVGLPTQEGSFDFLDLVLREVAIVGSVGHVYDEDFTAAVDLICSGRVNAAALITDRLALDDGIDRGIRRLAEGEDVGDALKILIRPN